MSNLTNGGRAGSGFSGGGAGGGFDGEIIFSGGEILFSGDTRST